MHECANMSFLSEISPDAIAGVLFGGVIVFVLQLLRDLVRDSRIRKSLKAAVYAEIRLCGETAATFLSSEPRVHAPLYRLPTICFQSNFRDLLHNGVVNDEGARALLLFYTEVETFNRGLDEAALRYGPNANVGQQTKSDTDQRNQLKARRIQGPNGQYYPSALDAVS